MFCKDALQRIVTEKAPQTLPSAFTVPDDAWNLQVGHIVSMRLPPNRNSPWSDRQRRICVIIKSEGPTRVMAVIDEEFHPRAALPQTSSHTKHLDWKSWSSPTAGFNGKKAAATPSEFHSLTIPTPATEWPEFFAVWG